MDWIETTITTEKGPQLICINPTNIKYVKQTADGRAIIVFVEGAARTVDDSYVTITSRLQ